MCVWACKFVCSPAVEVISCRTRGLRVTIPDPRGRKSLKTDQAHMLNHECACITNKVVFKDKLKGRLE